MNITKYILIAFLVINTTIVFSQVEKSVAPTTTFPPISLSSWEYNGSNITTVNNTANVGIGIDTPLEKLHINGSVRGDQGTGALRIQSGSGYIDVGALNSSWAHIYTDRSKFIFNKPVYSTAGAFHSYNTSDLTLSTSATVRLRIKNSTGNVGIGTASPTSKLHVKGSVLTESSGANLVSLKLKNNAWTCNQTASIEFWNGVNKNFATSRISSKMDGCSTGGEALIFETQTAGQSVATEKLRISGLGNVGIGTTTTGPHKLAVEGSIGAREVKITAPGSGWSDFVFENDYNLPTLKEVAQHINEKGHLIDVPSAKEVEENGFYLGEMDAKLLQKIEELTLYTLKQEEKINAANKQIEALEVQNQAIQTLTGLVLKLQSEIKELKK